MPQDSFCLHVTLAGRNKGQSKCYRCGHWYRNHTPCISREAHLALAEFATLEGRRWKTKLAECFRTGQYPDYCVKEEMQELREKLHKNFAKHVLTRFLLIVYKRNLPKKGAGDGDPAD